MLTELCQELKNWFTRDENKFYGKFQIVDGKLLTPPSTLKFGQYYRIVGSTFNDGVHKYGYWDEDSLIDESFDGSIWCMDVPAEVINLATDIRTFCSSFASVSQSPFSSESFGGYSYTKATGKNGVPLTWQDMYAKRLNKWRKIL